MDLKRLDIYIMSTTGYSREFSKNMVLKSDVMVNGAVCTKPGFKVSTKDVVTYTLPYTTYVSRGGYKLEKALAYFDINLDGLVCLDVGASTGGFTDCMLQKGASVVLAVDTGTNQLAEKLLYDERVVSVEKTNINTITNECLGKLINQEIMFASVDVSFVSITKILNSVFGLTGPYAKCVALIKPQFEAGRENLNKKGIVKNKKIHKNAIINVFECCLSMGFSPTGLIISPITGSDGNVEYLLFIDKKKSLKNKEDFYKIIDKVTMVSAD